MMTLPIPTKHLEAVIAAAREGVAYLNVGRSTVDLGRGPFVTGDAPSEWVEAATCDCVCHTVPGPPIIATETCHCIDGAPIHTITARCPRCPRCNTGGNFGGKCWECSSTGTVERKVTVQLVPVVPGLNGKGWAFVKPESAGMADIGTVIGPDPQPGDFVAIIKETP